MLNHYRVDECHSNARAEWIRQGKPMYPTPEQKQAIKAREGLELVEPPRRIAASNGQVKLALKLPVHSISLLVLSPATA